MKYKLINLKSILSTTFVWSHFSSWFMVTIFFNFSLTCNIFIWIHFWLIRKFKTRNPSKLSLIKRLYTFQTIFDLFSSLKKIVKMCKSKFLWKRRMSKYGFATQISVQFDEFLAWFLKNCKSKIRESLFTFLQINADLHSIWRIFFWQRYSKFYKSRLPEKFVKVCFNLPISLQFDGIFFGKKLPYSQFLSTICQF